MKLSELRGLQNFKSRYVKRCEPVLKYFTSKYSKVFKKCCRAVGIERRTKGTRFRGTQWCFTRVQHHLAKVDVASSNLVSRSEDKASDFRQGLFLCYLVRSIQTYTANRHNGDTKLGDTKLILYFYKFYVICPLI